MKQGENFNLSDQAPIFAFHWGTTWRTHCTTFLKVALWVVIDDFRKSNKNQAFVC